MSEQKDKLRDKFITLLEDTELIPDKSLVVDKFLTPFPDIEEARTEIWKKEQKIYDRAYRIGMGEIEKRCQHKLEEAKQVAFNKGVKRGTTIRNIDWNSENHQRHGKKMVQAREEARTQERERIHKSINEYYGRHDVEQGIIGFTQAVRQALKGESNEDKTEKK